MSKKVRFFGTCLCTYQSELELPDDIDVNDDFEVANYINSHINEAPALNNEFEYLGEDLEVTVDDLIYVEDGDKVTFK